jgi:hypothetical protein
MAEFPIKMSLIDIASRISLLIPGIMNAIASTQETHQRCVSTDIFFRGLEARIVKEEASSTYIIRTPTAPCVGV